MDEGYKYLAIGNSITIHSITSFWWNEVGMAVCDAEHDYYHLGLDYLKENNKSVKGVPYNFSVWETQSHDRDETLEYLDHYLSTELDLVTIQLAENASDLTTYQEDYVSLISYVREKAPNARILVIGDFGVMEIEMNLR
ncbi:SGNH/GDSL hydrolase family protein [Butyrivibrio sp.]|uniref:SGNH/GDSL hydrolase family protein n=1 Tax=Butyrivibrio sp. TaxID=28121 RepID=UPI0025BDB429|nr:SGNH/GDSL hydrolase family protein [Butyrivibrio sp.]MBE5837170.1 SGNH/GDSL hydrolase family protein [Butyrivibrio sp.]